MSNPVFKRKERFHLRNTQCSWIPCACTHIYTHMNTWIYSCTCACVYVCDVCMQDTGYTDTHLFHPRHNPNNWNCLLLQTSQDYMLPSPWLIDTPFYWSNVVCVDIRTHFSLKKWNLTANSSGERQAMGIKCYGGNCVNMESTRAEWG